MHDQGFIHTHNYMTGIRFDKQPFLTERTIFNLNIQTTNRHNLTLASKPKGHYTHYRTC